MFFVGHSHMECVAQAAESQGVAIPRYSFWSDDGQVEGSGADLRFGESLTQHLTDEVISFIGGGPQHVLGLNPHPIPFDFVLPSRLELPQIEGARLVPCEAVRAAMIKRGENDLALFALTARTSRRMVHIEPPPARFAEENMSHPAWRSLVTDSAHVSPPYFRLKMTQLYSEILAEVCGRLGVIYLRAPPEALDDEGFLKDQYAGMSCHGNVAYGALVLRQIMDLAA